MAEEKLDSSMALNSLTRAIAGKIAPRIVSAIMAIDGASACAGIKNEKKPGVAFKAKVNHYGAYNGKTESYDIPPRPFVSSIDGSINQGVADDLKASMKEIIQKPSTRVQAYNKVKGVLSRTSAHDASGKSLGWIKAYGWTGSPQKVMKRVADRMLEQQIKAFDTVVKNADSTIKRKGSEVPLVWTGELKKEIRAWTE